MTYSEGSPRGLGGGAGTQRRYEESKGLELRLQGISGWAREESCCRALAASLSQFSSPAPVAQLQLLLSLSLQAGQALRGPRGVSATPAVA